MVREILKKSPVFKLLENDDEAYREIDEITKIITQSLKNYCENDQLSIGIVGEVKSGKSTLSNALVGEAASPIGVTETTGSTIQFNQRSMILEVIF